MSHIDSGLTSPTDPSPDPTPAAAELRGKDLHHLADELTRPLRAAIVIQAHIVALPDDVRASLNTDLVDRFTEHLATVTDPKAVKRILAWERNTHIFATWVAKRVYRYCRWREKQAKNVTTNCHVAKSPSEREPREGGAE